MTERGRKRFTAAEKRARDREILAARSTGKTWAEIAARSNLSESAARRAAASAARLEAERGLGDLDAEQLLEQIVRAQARALYRLEELVLAENGAVCVGACRALG